VTYQFSRSCPSHEEGLDLLREAARASGVELEVEAVEVGTDEQAGRLGFAGSPTYLLAGRDPFPREEDGALPTPDTCRVYDRPGGRVGPLPHIDDLAAALREAARQPLPA
jgi:hypothetical protein